jgi:DNA invertase Pin-like site-specific DNA recombinase
LAEVMEFARQGDTIAVWRPDRLARSLRHLIDLADGVDRRGIGLRSLNESIDTTTASSRVHFTVLAAMGQMEVELLRGRTRAGLRAAASRGRIGGRPRALDQTKLRVAQALIANGTLSVAEITQKVGCAPSTLYRSLPGGRRGSTIMAATAPDDGRTVRGMEEALEASESGR